MGRISKICRFFILLLRQEISILAPIMLRKESPGLLGKFEIKFIR
jgi:hypothetical protein